jgi:hypothetical protein
MSTHRVAVVVAALALAPLTAHAYVQARTSTSKPLHWGPGCAVPLVVHLDNLAGANVEETRAAVKAAVAAWTSESCGGTTMTVTFAPGAGPLPDKDGVNSITVRPEGWCDANGEGPKYQGRCYDPHQTALTTTIAARANGQIIEADIQLNARLPSWRPGEDGAANLQAILTHELGHVLGFDHPCADGRPEPQVDDRGATVPSCQGVAAELKASVMYHEVGTPMTVVPLTTEDKRGVCAVYPKTAAAATCSPPPDMGSDGGCSYGAGGGPGPAAAALLALLGAAFIAARARSRGRARRRGWSDEPRRFRRR